MPDRRDSAVLGKCVVRCRESTADLRARRSCVLGKDKSWITLADCQHRYETEMTHYQSKPLKCETCGRSVTVRQLLRGASDYWGAVNVVISETQCCHSRQELRLATGKVMRGHVYAAGGPRFRAAEEWEAPITVRRGHGELSVELGARQWWIPARE